MTVDRFVELITAEEPALDRIMAVIASIDRPSPTEAQVIEELDRLADQIDGADADTIITGVFGTLGFNGNTARYYDAKNSLLHHVLDRRLGIPLSLAVVVVELARRHGVSLDAIGMPGHVLLGDGRQWFDPFAGGAALDRDGCERIFHMIHPDAPFQDGYLRPMPVVAIAGRTLENLRVAAMGSGDLSMLVSILALRAEVPGAPVDHRMELARALTAAGRHDQAAGHRDRLAQLIPNRAEHHLAEAARLRAHRN